MNPDFSIAVKKYFSTRTSLRVFLTGHASIIPVIDGTEIHGHVGSPPERYAISVLVKKPPAKTVKKEVIQKLAGGGHLALDVRLNTGEWVTGDSGEEYMLYVGRLAA